MSVMLLSERYKSSRRVKSSSALMSVMLFSERPKSIRRLSSLQVR
jgi:hypothetical protein